MLQGVPRLVIKVIPPFLGHALMDQAVLSGGERAYLWVLF